MTSGRWGASRTGGLAWWPLVEHWDGRAWSVVSAPHVGSGSELHAVAATGSDDVWAVGYSNWPTAPFSRTLVEHWDGTTWRIVTSPNPGAEVDSLFAVTAIASDDAWVVGEQTDNQFVPPVTLAEHWDGSEWTIVPTPNPAPDAKSHSACTTTKPSFR